MLLVLRCQTGDAAAFERLYERYEGSILYYVRRLLGGAPGSEDVAQEAWIRAFRRVGSLSDPAAFRSWLYRIARNAALDSLRRAGRQSEEPDVGIEIVSAAAGPETALETAADADLLHAALESLSRPHRDVLTLRFLDDLSYDEMAAVLGCPLGTVKSRLHHAKRALRRSLARGSQATRGRGTGSMSPVADPSTPPATTTARAKGNQEE